MRLILKPSLDDEEEQRRREVDELEKRKFEAEEAEAARKRPAEGLEARKEGRQGRRRGEREEARDEEESEGREAEELEVAKKGPAEAERARPRPPPPPGLRQTFAPYKWLSDESISFAYSRIGPEGGGDSCGAEGSKLPMEVLLLEAGVAFWLAMQTEVKHRDEACTELKLTERRLVLCPVNDNQDGDAADAGTHWGLLVWDRQGMGNGRFLYYDSGFVHMASNHEQAQALANHLAGEEVTVKAGQCAKQTNTFDCGMYVILFSEIIVKTFLARAGSSTNLDDAEKAPAWEASLVAVTPKEVSDRRASLYRTLTTVSAAAVAGG